MTPIHLKTWEKPEFPNVSQLKKGVFLLLLAFLIGPLVLLGALPVTPVWYTRYSYFMFSFVEFCYRCHLQSLRYYCYCINNNSRCGISYCCILCCYRDGSIQCYTHLSLLIFFFVVFLAALVLISSFNINLSTISVTGELVVNMYVIWPITLFALSPPWDEVSSLNCHYTGNMCQVIACQKLITCLQSQSHFEAFL